jgi:hypothetical protein
MNFNIKVQTKHQSFNLIALDRCVRTRSRPGISGVDRPHQVERYRRSTESAEQAILSAIGDFERAGVGGTVERAGPEDLASLSEIAQRVGVTRASLQKYARGNSKVGKDFPAPVQNLSLPRRELFSTYEVMCWMLRRRRAEISADALELYGAIAGINKALEIRRAGKDENVGRLVALLSAACHYPQPISSRWSSSMPK